MEKLVGGGRIQPARLESLRSLQSAISSFNPKIWWGPEDAHRDSDAPRSVTDLLYILGHHTWPTSASDRSKDDWAFCALADFCHDMPWLDSVDAFESMFRVRERTLEHTLDEAIIRVQLAIQDEAPERLLAAAKMILIEQLPVGKRLALFDSVKQIARLVWKTFAMTEGYLAVWNAARSSPQFSLGIPTEEDLRDMASGLEEMCQLDSASVRPLPQLYLPDHFDDFAEWVLEQSYVGAEALVERAKRVFEAFRFLCKADMWYTEQEYNERVVNHILEGNTEEEALALETTVEPERPMLDQEDGGRVVEVSDG